MVNFVARYIVQEGDFILIKIPLTITSYNLDDVIEDIKSLVDYKFLIIDVCEIEIPNISILEVLVRMHRISHNENKTAIINASRNYKKLLKNFSLDKMFIITHSITAAMRYYKYYMFEKLWKI